MSLEAIKQVTQAEDEHRARKAEAQAEAKRLVADAERAGRARLEELSASWRSMRDAIASFGVE